MSEVFFSNGNLEEIKGITYQSLYLYIGWLPNSKAVASPCLANSSIAFPPDNVEKAGRFRSFSLLATFFFGVGDKRQSTRSFLFSFTSTILYQALRLEHYQCFLLAVEIHQFCLPQLVDSVHQMPRGLERGNQPW